MEDKASRTCSLSRRSVSGTHTRVLGAAPERQLASIVRTHQRPNQLQQPANPVQCTRTAPRACRPFQMVYKTRCLSLRSSLGHEMTRACRKCSRPMKQNKSQTCRTGCVCDIHERAHIYITGDSISRATDRIPSDVDSYIRGNVVKVRGTCTDVL